MDQEIAKVSTAVQVMRTVARLPRALMGGTRAMRAAGMEYLPKSQTAKDQLESAAAYNKRLAMSFLFNGYGKTTRHMTGRVFHRPITLADVPTAADPIETNFDANGNSFNSWSRATFQDIWVGGFNLVLVDRPPRPEDETGADALSRNPYARRYPIESIRGWKTEPDPAGGWMFSEVRVDESISLEGFGNIQIRRLVPGGWEVWREPIEKGGKGQEWVLSDAGEMGLPAVPVVPFYGLKQAELRGVTPTEDQAWINLAHWQSASAQRYLLNVIRVPFLLLAGFSTDAVKPINISSLRALVSKDPDAKVQWVEHTGKAIDAGRTDLEDLKREMLYLGQEVQEPKGNVTATSSLIDAGEARSTLDGVALEFTNSLQSVVDLWAEWLEIDSAGTVELNTRDLLTLSGSEDMGELSEMTSAGQLSLETLWEELVRRGKLSEAFDAKREQERLSKEGSPPPDA